MAFSCPLPDGALAAEDLEIGTPAVGEILAKIVQPVAPRTMLALPWGELVAMSARLAQFKSVFREAELPLGVDTTLLLALGSAALVSAINTFVLGSIIVTATCLGLDLIIRLENPTWHFDQEPMSMVSQALSSPNPGFSSAYSCFTGAVPFGRGLTSVSGGSSSFLATLLPFSAFALLVAGSSSGLSRSRFLSLSPSSPLSLTGGSVTSPFASIVATRGGLDHLSEMVLPATADLSCVNTHEQSVGGLWRWSVCVFFFSLVGDGLYCIYCSPCRLGSI